VRYLGAVIAALLSSFALAGPALADDATVGPGQVVTDPSAETEPAAPVAGDGAEDPDAPAADAEDPDFPVPDDGDVTDAPAPPPDASGRRGEVHVLGTHAHSTVPATPAAASPTAARTLPFTGIDAGALLLMGLALLAGGSGLLAVLRQPVK
jgi:hypothetical protein